MTTRPVPRNQSPWFEHLGPRQDSALRLFCFPYAGGSGQVFRPWQKHFPSEVDLCLVHLPGRGRRMSEPPFKRLPGLVDAIAEAMQGELKAPFAFYGHSMGASISFELARELRKRNAPGPVHLFVSGRRAPQIPDSNPPTFDLPQDEFIAEIKRLNGTPKELLDNPETTELFMPILRADFELVDAYEYDPGEPLVCPIHAYGGLQDIDVKIEHLRGWQEQTSAEFQLRMFPGDHFFIHSSSNQFLENLRHDVVSALRKLLERR